MCQIKILTKTNGKENWWHCYQYDSYRWRGPISGSIHKKNQSDNLVWHQQQLGQITSSLIHATAHTFIDNPAKSIIKEICCMDTNQIKAPSLSWGCDNEQLALLEYLNIFSDPDFIGDSLCINPLVNLLRLWNSEIWLDVKTEWSLVCNITRQLCILFFL